MAPRAWAASEIRTYPVCRIPIADLDTASAAERIVQAAASASSFQVHLCNAYTLSLVDRDPLLRDALLASDLNLADGTPVAWLGRTQGEPGPVRGPGLVGAVAGLGLGVAHHYLWGGKDGVADGMADGLREAVPGVSIVGTETPPFAPLSDEDLIDLAVRVRASGANILWVGLGTPNQDYVVRRLAPLLDLPIVPVGAAFDFWSGAVAEAPAFLHGSGLRVDLPSVSRASSAMAPLPDRQPALRGVGGSSPPPPEHAGPGRPQLLPVQRTERGEPARPRRGQPCSATAGSTSSRCSRTPTPSPAVWQACSAPPRGRSTPPPACVGSSGWCAPRGPTSSTCTTCSR